MDIVEDAVNSKLRSHLAGVISLVCSVQILQVYMHDLSLLRLILNMTSQHSVLSPTFERYRGHAPPPNRRTVMGLILGVQLWAIAAHVIGSLPEPSFDGRIHGLVFVEFIGVRPVARFWLVLWDLMVLALQFVEFAQNFPVPAERAGPANPPEAADEPTLREQTAAEVAKIMSGTAVVYTCNLPQVIAYNWAFVAPPQPPGEPASPSSSDSAPTLSPSILPLAVPVNV